MNECIFEFKHPHRCRDRCNLWIEDGAADLCIWHREGAPPASFDIRSVLLKVISASDHWLEGANLEASDLSELDLTGAKLPNANLADCNLKGTILDAALLESASLISANLTGSSLVGTS